MNPPTKISIEHFPFVKENSIEETFRFDPCIRFVTVQIFQKVRFILIALKKKTFNC